jgi:hypothetical protein
VESYFVLQFSYQSESFIYVEHCEDLFALLVYRPVEASDLLSFYGLRCSDSVIEAASLNGTCKRCRMLGNQLGAEIIISVSAPKNRAGYVYRSKF